MTPSVSSSGSDAALDLALLLDARLERIVAMADADGGWIAVEAERLSPDSARGTDPGAGGESTLETVSRTGVSDDEVTAIVSSARDDGTIDRIMRGRETIVVARPRAIVVAVPREGAGVLQALSPMLPEGIRTMLALPLESQGQVLGLIALVTRSPRTHSPKVIALVSTAAGELAGALDQALISRAQQRRIDRQRLLLDAAEMVHRSIDSGSLETTILAEASRLVGAQKAVLLVVRGDVLVAKETFGLSERCKRLFVVPLEDALFGSAVLTGQTVAVDDVDAPAGETGPGAVHPLAECHVRALLAAPLQSYRGTYGALVLFYERPQRFGEDEKTMLRTFSIQAAIALDNRRLMQEKDAMAVHDGLTGVYNRSYLELTLERTTKELRRNGGVVSILFFDVDGMKTVNDGHGHHAGDRLLRDVASLLGESCRATDIVARYGGDEFVMLMPGTDAEGARRVALKVDAAIAQHNAAKAGPVRLSVSMGMHTADGAGVDDLLREADRRMYEMKRARAPHDGEDAPAPEPSAPS